MKTPAPDIKFIFGNVFPVQNLLNVSCSIKNDEFIIDIYHKPTHLCSYLHYNSCYPKRTKNTIVFDWDKES